jgi:hypothetical protein
MIKYKFPPAHIFNVDESGILNVQDPILFLIQRNKT